ncbi:arylamine N-acetyltransferase, pineal gland isozyme NAT-3-like [Lampris incognitus]|uniref:arylamine N-acetyltransferase, pineal gland isozyme NAT-3-like n=1 Tax=Lampris incognitus TaxID=2546036 RepID=UPI0024B62B34|nr:arylamine N-acetyltransferase, pineal gland isozyme NAT-3-like [Lampris incognitus]
MDPRGYLLRIGYAAPAAPSTLSALRSLHNSHLLSVPFENLTVHSGGRVQLDLPPLYDKIVRRRRGGFCYENNTLFSWLLSQVGFQVTLLSCQVRNSITCRYGPPFDHLALMVALGGQRWLCDVGFGALGFRDPLSLDTGEPQRQGHRVYRVRKASDMHFLEGKGQGDVKEEEWVEIYKFTLQPRRPEDFAEMCVYHQTSPSSLFFCKSLCSQLQPGGRLTYIGHKLISTTFPTQQPGSTLHIVTRELEDEEIPVILKEHFGVVLTSPLIPKDEAITPPLTMY